MNIKILKILQKPLKSIPYDYLVVIYKVYKNLTLLQESQVTSNKENMKKYNHNIVELSQIHSSNYCYYWNIIFNSVYQYGK